MGLETTSVSHRIDMAAVKKIYSLLQKKSSENPRIFFQQLKEALAKGAYKPATLKALGMEDVNSKYIDGVCTLGGSQVFIELKKAKAKNNTFSFEGADYAKVRKNWSGQSLEDPMCKDGKLPDAVILMMRVYEDRILAAAMMTSYAMENLSLTEEAADGILKVKKTFETSKFRPSQEHRAKVKLSEIAEIVEILELTPESCSILGRDLCPKARKMVELPPPACTESAPIPRLPYDVPDTAVVESAPLPDTFRSVPETVTLTPILNPAFTSLRFAANSKPTELPDARKVRRERSPAPAAATESSGPVEQASSRSKSEVVSAKSARQNGAQPLDRTLSGTKVPRPAEQTAPRALPDAVPPVDPRAVPRAAGQTPQRAGRQLEVARRSTEEGLSETPNVGSPARPLRTKRKPARLNDYIE